MHNDIAALAVLALGLLKVSNKSYAPLQLIVTFQGQQDQEVDQFCPFPRESSQI